MTPSRTSPYLAILVATCVVAADVRADMDFGANDIATVFFVDKSDDRNRVDYGLRLNAQCEPANNDPLFMYWREFEAGRNGRVTHGLNLLEGPVYGAARQNMVERGANFFVLEVELRSIPGRTIRIRVDENHGRCVAVARTRISGVETQLRSAHVTLAGPGNVRYVDLIGGNGRRERLTP